MDMSRTKSKNIMFGGLGLIIIFLVIFLGTQTSIFAKGGFFASILGVNFTPTGYHDAFEGSQQIDYCRVAGWVVDKDNKDTDLNLKIFSDGTEIAQTKANILRSDLVNECSGGTCAYDLNIYSLISKDTPHVISVQAQDAQTKEWVNVGGTPKTLTCISEINSLPVGYHDAFQGSQQIDYCRAAGWVVDPDNRNADLNLKIFSDGKEIAQTKANILRSDLANECPGGTCAYDLSIYDLISKDTSHSIKVQAQDAQTGEWVDLGGTSKTLTCVSALKVSASADTPDTSVLVMGSQNNEVSKIKFSVPPQEPLFLERFSIKLDETEDRKNITGVALKYQTKSQTGTNLWTTSSKKKFGGNSIVSFDFTGNNRPYLLNANSNDIVVLVDIDGYNNGKGAHSGDSIQLSPAVGKNEIKFYGETTKKSIIGAQDETKNAFKYHYIFRSKPVFAKSAWSGDNSELARFTITAVGGNVRFNTTSNNNNSVLMFKVSSHSKDGESGRLYLYDWNNDVISVTPPITWNSNNIYANFLFEKRGVIIPAETTKAFYVKVEGGDVKDFVKTDEYLYLRLLNEGGDSVTSYKNCSIVWDDFSNNEGLALNHRICMPSYIKNIGSFPFSFGVLRGTTR